MNSRHSRVRSFRANKTSQQNERDGDRRALSLASWTTKAHGALPPLAFVATHSRALCATRAENGESPTRDDRDVCHSLLNFERVVETVSVCDISETLFSIVQIGDWKRDRVPSQERKSQIAYSRWGHQGVDERRREVGIPAHRTPRVPAAQVGKGRRSFKRCVFS